MKTKAEIDQKKRFLDAAREAGCDESPEAFERAFRAIVPPKRHPTAVPKPQGKGAEK